MKMHRAADGTWFRLDQVRELRIDNATSDPSASGAVPYYLSIAVLEDGSTHPLGEREKNRDHSQVALDRLAARINDPHQGVV